MWLEDLTAPGNLRDLRNIQALNTPLRTSQWRKLLEKQRAVGFTWEALPLEKFGNGPVLVDQWDEVFRRRVRPPSDMMLSIHAVCRPGARTRTTSFILDLLLICSGPTLGQNCYSKTLIEADAKLHSFLFRPRSRTLRLGNASSESTLEIRIRL